VRRRKLLGPKEIAQNCRKYSAYPVASVVYAEDMLRCVFAICPAARAWERRRVFSRAVGMGSGRLSTPRPQRGERTQTNVPDGASGTDTVTESTQRRRALGRIVDVRNRWTGVWRAQRLTLLGGQMPRQELLGVGRNLAAVGRTRLQVRR